MNREQVIKAFEEYTGHYDQTDQKISLKIYHTYKVAEMSEKIAASVNADTDLAWLCGMLHDIGRFEQLRRYNTFVDAVSVDHAKFGADLLFKEGLFSEFTSENDSKQVLEKAIRCHSLYRLPEGLTEEELLYSQILRDADKLDIFRAICETPLEELYSFSLEELKNSAVSEIVKECFRQRKAVLKSLWKTPADHYVSHICLAFELVYPASREIARKQGYVDQLLAFEAENLETAEWFANMRENMWS